MTLPEGAGRVASSAVDALRHTPSLLAVILLQIATMAMIYFVASANAERQQTRELALIERCYPERP